MVSVFARRDDIEGPDGYVFFVADSQRAGEYELIKNVVNSQNYVSNFELHDYAVAPEDILFTGRESFDAALNTINIGKFNLGFASIGIATHAFYEAITHAENRVLFGSRVTEFAQVRRLFADAYARLVAMKLFGTRAIDYMRSAGPDDRRYLLFNPLTKMKVTTEGEKVIDHLWDVIAAKGFEKDGYFEMAVRDIRGLPKLEGTVHVNMVLVLKFMASYLFNPGEVEAPPSRTDTADDEFLFHQGPAKGLSKIQFEDWQQVYARHSEIPNVAVFAEQAASLKELLASAPPDTHQQKDLDFLLTLGELFTLIPYGQLILEQAEITGLAPDTLDQIFDVFVRDFSAYAIELHGKQSASAGAAGLGAARGDQAGEPTPSASTPSSRRCGRWPAPTRWLPRRKRSGERACGERAGAAPAAGVLLRRLQQPARALRRRRRGRAGLLHPRARRGRPRSVRDRGGDDRRPPRRRRRPLPPVHDPVDLEAAALRPGAGDARAREGHGPRRRRADRRHVQLDRPRRARQPGAEPDGQRRRDRDHRPRRGGRAGRPRRARAVDVRALPRPPARDRPGRLGLRAGDRQPQPRDRVPDAEPGDHQRPRRGDARPLLRPVLGAGHRRRPGADRRDARQPRRPTRAPASRSCVPTSSATCSPWR